MNMSAHMDITGGYYITKDFTYRIVYISAMGYGGQYIVIIPQLEVVSIISSHMPKRGLVPLKLFIEHVQEILIIYKKRRECMKDEKFYLYLDYV